MALNFDSSPYLQVWQAQRQREEEEAQRPQIYNQQILQGLQSLAENRRQQQLMDIQKQTLESQNKNQAFNQSQTLRENTSKYGEPIDANVFVGVPNGMGQSRLFDNKPMQVGAGRNLREMFNTWRSGGMKPTESRPEFMDALGQDERKQFYENANPKPTQKYVIPTYDTSGNVTGYSDVPEGARPFGSGKPTVTPGQRLDAKKEQMQPKEKAILDSTLAKFDAMIAEAEAIKNHPSLDMATGMSSFMGRVPGTGAKNVASRINTLKSKTAFNILQEMRQNSPTGGALGNVSDRENQMLSENISSLDRGQSDVDVADSLQRVIDYANGAKKRLQQAYDDYYGDSSSTVKPIVQRNKITGQTRISYDGGQTWQMQ